MDGRDRGCFISEGRQAQGGDNDDDDASDYDGGDYDSGGRQ